MANILLNEVPNSAFMQLVDIKKNPRQHQPVCPPSVSLVVENIDVSAGSQQEHIQSLVSQLQLEEDMCISLEEATREQSAGNVWMDQRKGRITASNLKRVFTRAATLKKNPDADAASLVRTILGMQKKTPMTHAMKHGVAMEPHAKGIYTKIQRKSHKSFSVRDSGLVLYRPKQYIAASPDLILTCKCCGVGVVEIVQVEQSVQLKSDSPYMYQIQGQMACMEVGHGDFFVYTSHGYHLNRIGFNKELWEEMMSRIEYMWLTFVAPALLSGSMTDGVDRDHCYSAPTSSAAVEPSTSQDHMSIPSTSTQDHMSIPSTSTQDHMSIPSTSTQDHMSKPSTSTVLTTPKLPRVYLCGVCGLDCKEDDRIESCEYKMWLHHGCAGIQPGNVQDENDFWL